MTKPIDRDPLYRKRAFDAAIIELCVRWYISYQLSAVVSGSRRDDGGARRQSRAFDDPSKRNDLVAIEISHVAPEPEFVMRGSGVRILFAASRRVRGFPGRGRAGS
jgi:hypothetical protein